MGDGAEIVVDPAALSEISNNAGQAARSVAHYSENSGGALVAAASAAGHAGLQEALRTFNVSWDPLMAALAQKTAALAEDLGKAAETYSQADIRSATTVAHGGTP